MPKMINDYKWSNCDDKYDNHDYIDMIAFKLTIIMISIKIVALIMEVILINHSSIYMDSSFIDDNESNDDYNILIIIVWRMKYIPISTWINV